MTTDTNILTADRVNNIFGDCLFKDGEGTNDHIVAEGVIQTVGFHPGRIEEHRQEIHDMLTELPDEFKTSGGGWLQFPLRLPRQTRRPVDWCAPDTGAARSARYRHRRSRILPPTRDVAGFTRLCAILHRETVGSQSEYDKWI